ncbi:MAG: YjfB family protein [Clostridiales Family XIII bacterium]|jgi:hypothetical protein|nr:YjfB family protein [Clostridiales Family XIII bacterium]
MDFYGIAAMSMSLSQMKIAQSIDYTMMRKVMDLQEQSVEQMLSIAESAGASAPAPPSEHILDVLV